MKKGPLIVFLLGFIICNNSITAQKKREAAKDTLKKETGLTSSTFGGLTFRSSGPAWASDRLSEMASGTYGSNGDITPIAKEQLEIIKAEFPPVLERVKKAGQDLQKLDKQLDAIKAPWTPGRIPAL